MWFDIIKIGVPRSRHQKKRYNKRLIRRFLEQIPNGEEFTVKDIIQFWESPEQQEYSTEYRPDGKSLGHLLKRTGFRISVVKKIKNTKIYVKGTVSNSDAEKRAEQFIIDTANTLDYVTIENRIVKIKPNWLMDLPYKHLEYYAFNLDDIHTTSPEGQLCVYKVFTANEPWQQLCLLGPEQDNPLADNYVTVMLMAGHQNQWINMWKEE